MQAAIKNVETKKAHFSTSNPVRVRSRNKSIFYWMRHPILMRCVAVTIQVTMTVGQRDIGMAIMFRVMVMIVPAASSVTVSMPMAVHRSSSSCGLCIELLFLCAAATRCHQTATQPVILIVRVGGRGLMSGL